MTNTVECPICYEQKRPYYSDNIGCNNYKLICEDCITQLRTNHCPFCRNIHHERIVNNSVTNNTKATKIIAPRNKISISTVERTRTFTSYDTGS